jgi:hypothetical protein
MIPVGFTRDEAPGAIRNGTRVVKIDSMSGDTHKIGDEAVVVGSMGPIEYQGRKGVYGYFVEWDDMPGLPVMIVSWRIREVTTQ